MNKTALKNFAVWARNKLIADITYKAGLMGITGKGIKSALPQSTEDTEFYDIGTKKPYLIGGEAVKQRRRLAELINGKAESSDYNTAYRSVVEEVAYTWFNRLIAVRFMEVNDYLPSHIRVLSSDSADKLEPDLVTTPFDAELELTEAEKAEIIRMKNDNQVDDLFRMLFIKQCNALNALLPKLFEKTADYSELLLNVSVTDQDGVVYHLVHDIDEKDFKVRTEADQEAVNRGEMSEEDAPTGQVEIIGWLYQYYNTEPKDETFALLKKNVKITKERIPSATQLFTPDWIVRYMVENSLGRLWLEGHPNEGLKSGWKYYLDEAKQEPEVQAQLDKIREEYKTVKPEDIKVIDPCMGSGHILVYAFDVLMQIYETAGYSKRDAAKSILEHNLYGLDIDDRAFQLAYFAVMMKVRQYNRFILNGETVCHVYSIQESNGFNPDYLKLLGNDDLKATAEKLIDVFTDAKEYGSILNVDIPLQELEALQHRIDEISKAHYDNFFDSARQSGIVTLLAPVLRQAFVMAQKYDVVVTNPPYMSSGNMGIKLLNIIKKDYSVAKNDTYSAFIFKCKLLTKPKSFYSMVTMQGWMFTQRFEELRKILLRDSLITMIHIGYNSFPELNSKIAQATTFIFRNSTMHGFKSKYFDLTNNVPQSADKQIVFEDKLRKKDCIAVCNERFEKLPGYQFAYWISENLLNDFSNGQRLGNIANPRQGLATGDNDTFLRIWSEVLYNKLGFRFYSNDDFRSSTYLYAPYNKGGEYCKWYGNRDLVIKFDSKNYTILQGQGNHLPSKQYYFCESATWSALTTSGFSCRYCENGFVFDTKGSSCFCKSKDELYTIMGFLNSCVANKIFKILSPTVDYNAGTVANAPILSTNNPIVNSIVQKNVDITKQNWDSFETSWDFKQHPLSKPLISTEWENEPDSERSYLKFSYDAWKTVVNNRFLQLKSNEEELNRIFIDIYGLQDELTPEVEDKDVTVARIYDTKAEIPESMKGNNYVLTKCDVIKSLISYAVGCMFGRYSLDKPGLAYAGGEWDDSKYGSFIPDKDNILPITDEEYFGDDIVGFFCAWLKKVYGEKTLEENLDFIANALGNKGNTSREIIRNYFLNDFFKDHCKTYKKRPIYWLFDSGRQNGFKALIYMHRYNEDTVGNLRIDYLHRMERVYESEIARMQDTIDNSANAREVTAAAKRKEKLQKQMKECREYDEKIAHLALARIAINLDDGVKVNYEKAQTDTDGKEYEVMAKI